MKGETVMLKSELSINDEILLECALMSYMRECERLANDCLIECTIKDTFIREKNRTIELLIRAFGFDANYFTKGETND